MARSAHVQSRGENINHFASVRLRVFGEGNLQIGAFGLADTLVKQLVDLPLEAATNVEPTRLMNVSLQRLSFEFKVTEFNEWFEIGRLVIYQKVLYTQGPNF